MQIPSLLPAADVKRLLDLAAGSFVDGRATARGLVEDVKHNQQLQPTSENSETLRKVVAAALEASEAFQGFALPKFLMQPMINRHAAGMYYDRHLDAPVMLAGGVPVRTDISVTIFLSPPDSYQGGALCIETEAGEAKVKLAPGDAFAYDTTMIHRVERVTEGVRLAAVTWVQSLVRDPAKRRILRQLSEARRQVHAAAPDSEVVELLNHCGSNLRRMWVET